MTVNNLDDCEWLNKKENKYKKIGYSNKVSRDYCLGNLTKLCNFS